MSRTALFSGILLLPALLVSALPAQQEIRTVVARGVFPLRVGERVTGQTVPGEILSVVTSQDDLIWVQGDENRKGWLKRDQAVPLADAEPLYSELIRREPRNPMHYERRALLWWNRGELERAAADYDSAVKLGSRSSAVYLNRGIHRATSGQFEQAIADYDQAIRLGQDDPYVYVNRGVAQFAQGKHDEAIADFDAALERGAKTYSVYVNRATARLAGGQEVAAIDDLNEAIRLEPENPAGYYERGRAWQQLDKLDQAIADFDAGLRLDPEFVQAYGGRGFAWFLKNEHEKAIADFDQVIRRNPQAAVAYNNRGYNQQALGRYAQAATDFAEAIELAPQYALAHENLAWLLATCPDDRVRDGRAALAAAIKACEVGQEKAAGAWKALAAAYAETGEFERAVAEQTKVLELVSEDEKPDEQQLLELYKSGRPYRISAPKPADATSGAKSSDS